METNIEDILTKWQSYQIKPTNGYDFVFSLPFDLTREVKMWLRDFTEDLLLIDKPHQSGNGRVVMVHFNLRKET